MQYLPPTAIALAACTTLGSQALGDVNELDLLYVGSPDSARSGSFETFLSEHFANVRMIDRKAFDQSMVGDADVVLLDWSQSEVDIMNMASITSPLGERSTWATPTVLLGSSGLLIAGPWQTLGAYG